MKEDLAHPLPLISVSLQAPALQFGNLGSHRYFIHQLFYDVTEMII